MRSAGTDLGLSGLSGCAVTLQGLIKGNVRRFCWHNCGLVYTCPPPPVDYKFLEIPQ